MPVLFGGCVLKLKNHFPFFIEKQKLKERKKSEDSPNKHEEPCTTFRLKAGMPKIDIKTIFATKTIKAQKEAILYKGSTIQVFLRNKEHW
jgi:hypothetical protein